LGGYQARQRTLEGKIKEVTEGEKPVDKSGVGKGHGEGKTIDVTKGMSR